MSSDRHLSRIPPLSSAETLAFFISGKMPERFKGCFDRDRDEVLRQNGVQIDTDKNGGFYYGDYKE